MGKKYDIIRCENCNEEADTVTADDVSICMRCLRAIEAAEKDSSIATLRAEIEAKDAEIALLEKQIIGRDKSVQIAWNQKAELGARVKKVEKERDEAFGALAILCEPTQWPINLEDITADIQVRIAELRAQLAVEKHTHQITKNTCEDTSIQLAAMTSRYSRAATDIASLEAQLAEANDAYNDLSEVNGKLHDRAVDEKRRADAAEARLAEARLVPVIPVGVGKIAASTAYKDDDPNRVERQVVISCELDPVPVGQHLPHNIGKTTDDLEVLARFSIDDPDGAWSLLEVFQRAIENARAAIDDAREE